MIYTRLYQIIQPLIAYNFFMSIMLSIISLLLVFFFIKLFFYIIFGDRK